MVRTPPAPRHGSPSEHVAPSPRSRGRRGAPAPADIPATAAPAVEVPRPGDRGPGDAFRGFEPVGPAVGRPVTAPPAPRRPIDIRVGERPGAGKPAHRKPNHTFRVVGVFVLVVGALAGGYLGFGRADHPTIADAVTGLAVSTTGIPTPTGTPLSDQAAVLAQQKAAAAAKSAAAQASKADQVAGRQQQASRSSPRPTYPVPTSCKEFTGNRQLGCGLLLDAGFNIDQFPCLDKLWTKESHWNTKASNASSGAYGIPQALPGDKMAAYGSDWRTNPVPQIKWGLSYIKGRYGSPCAAWDHSQATGWY